MHRRDFRHDGSHRTLLNLLGPVIFGLVLIGHASPVTAQAMSQDYPQWRGPNRDGSAASFSAPSTWPETLTQKWKVDVGPGYATPIVIGTRVYSFTRQNGEEVMMALDATTGKSIWRTAYAAPYKMNPATMRHGEGPKSTPLYAGGKLFTLGIGGIASAFDASNGKLLWQKSVSETRAVCQCICATGERRWASGRRTPGAGGCAGRPSEGLRTNPNPVLREAPQPRRNSGFPSGCYAASWSVLSSPPSPWSPSACRLSTWLFQ